MSEVLVAPSILSADFANLQKDIEKVELNGADWVHIDVMDGHFVPNITIGAPVVKSIRKVTSLPLDAHLMIENPIKYIPDFLSAGADVISFHIEAQADINKAIQSIKNAGARAGIAIKPKTSIDIVLPYIDMLDMVVIMTVEPGFSGQCFMPECAQKIKTVRQISKNKDLIIQVDGGMNKETSAICRTFGANCLVGGNYIYKNEDIQIAISDLKGR